MSLLNSRLSLLCHQHVNRIFKESSTIQIRNYAARKGTRERRAKKKVKVEVEKVGFIPHNLRGREKLLALRPLRKYDDSWKGDPVDDVYCMKYYKWIVNPFQDAVKCHRETHHPTMYNQPEANLHVQIELNMEGEKKNRFVDDFSRIVAIPHKFEHGEERSILVFSKTDSVIQEAQSAGATLSGGVELIKQIQNGTLLLQDFQHVIAHPDILPELVQLRGLMKRKFPNPRNGTLDVNVGDVVTRFLHGINYQAKKDEYEKDFGIIETIIGNLKMEDEHLEGNFAALIRDVYSMKPKREGTFINRCLLLCPPSKEKLKVDHNLYVDKKSTKSSSKDNDDGEDDEVGERVAL